MGNCFPRVAEYQHVGLHKPRSAGAKQRARRPPRKGVERQRHQQRRDMSLSFPTGPADESKGELKRTSEGRDVEPTPVVAQLLRNTEPWTTALAGGCNLQYIELEDLPSGTPRHFWIQSEFHHIRDYCNPSPTMTTFSRFIQQCMMDNAPFEPVFDIYTEYSFVNYFNPERVTKNFVDSLVTAKMDNPQVTTQSFGDLSAFVSDFRHCYGTDKSGCPWNSLARFHHADVRNRSGLMDSTDVLHTENLDELARRDRLDEKHPEYEHDFLAKKFSASFIKDFRAIMHGGQAGRKAWLKERDKEWREAARLNHERRHMEHNLPMADAIHALFESRRLVILATDELSIDLLQDYFMTWMDEYLMLRCNGRFVNETRPRFKASSNNFIFVGSAHGDTYRQVFQYLHQLGLIRIRQWCIFGQHSTWNHQVCSDKCLNMSPYVFRLLVPRDKATGPLDVRYVHPLQAWYNAPFYKGANLALVVSYTDYSNSFAHDTRFMVILQVVYGYNVAYRWSHYAGVQSHVRITEEVSLVLALIQDWITRKAQDSDLLVLRVQDAMEALNVLRTWGRESHIQFCIENIRKGNRTFTSRSKDQDQSRPLGYDKVYVDHPRLTWPHPMFLTGPVKDNEEED
jgi:hypothetical protein